MSFFFGISKGLKLEDSGSCSEHRHEIFRVDGNQGDRWTQANINIPILTRPHYFVIKAVHGDGVYGDTAIDDIKYVGQNCSITNAASHK